MALVELTVESYALGKYEVQRETRDGLRGNLNDERKAIAAEIKSAVERAFSAYGIQGEVVLR